MMHKTGLTENNPTVNCPFGHNEAIYIVHNEASHAHIEPPSNAPNWLLLLYYSWFPSFLCISIVCHFKNKLFSVFKKILSKSRKVLLWVYTAHKLYYLYCPSGLTE